MPEALLPRARHERSDVTLRFALSAFGGVLLALLASGLLAMWLYPQVLTDRRLPTALPAAPAPRLQTDAAREMQQFRAKDRALLEQSGWIDEANGIAHIPIEEAMRRIARDGVPDWPTR
jgi:hypothetical protein